MDVLLLSRLQFALTIMFHYLFPPLTIGLGVVLLTGYAILDGFDLGVGILHLAARTDRERRILMNSIGPLWDGNEVWLVTFGGAMFAMHGAIYLYLKTEGALQERIYTWMWRSFGFFLVLYMFTTMYTLVSIPKALRQFEHRPWAWAVVVVNVLVIANIPRSIFLKRPLQAFLSSCLAIAGFIFLFSIALYPNMMTSSLQPEWSLTIVNAASSAKTLRIMLIIAALGMPFVLAYTAVIYWVFRGKVEMGEHSY